MKTLLSAAIMLCLSFSAARAQEAFGENTGGANKLQEFIKAADRNGDGKIDLAERTAASKNMEDFLRKQFIAKADTNSDGKIDMSERAKAMQLAEKQRFDWMKTFAGQLSGGGGLANGTSTSSAGATTTTPNQNAREKKIDEAKRRAMQQQQQQPGGSFGPNPAQGVSGQLNPGQANGNPGANPNAFGPGGVRPGQGSSFGPPKGKTK